MQEWGDSLREAEVLDEVGVEKALGFANIIVWYGDFPDNIISMQDCCS